MVLDTTYVTVFDAAKGEQLQQQFLKRGGPLATLAISRRRERLLVGDVAGVLHMVSAQDLSTHYRRRVTDYPIRDVSFSPSGFKLAACWGEALTVLGEDSGGPLLPSAAHEDEVTAIAWEPAGERLWTVANDKLYRWDTRDFGPPAPPLDQPVQCMALAPDGERGIFGLQAGALATNVLTGRMQARLAGGRSPRRPAVACAWSRSGELAAAVFEDRTLRLWDTESWDCSLVLALDADCVALELGPNSAELVWIAADPDGPGSVRRVDTADGEELARHSCQTAARAVTIAESGSIYFGDDDGQLLRWKPDAPRPERVTRLDAGIRSLALGPQDRWIACGREDGPVDIVPLAPSVQPARLDAHAAAVTCIAVGPDGTLATGGVDEQLVIWDRRTAVPILHIRDHTAPVLDVAWGAAGSRLFSTDGRHLKLSLDFPWEHHWNELNAPPPSRSAWRSSGG